ncbi:unnamed protein product [Symbiodinium necroappetens]|uniref:Uncharacterized protein n=1 Tax=Symbiodinium necroappetens TaxID=1628268 RepID=A0A812YAG2_9DINO|nr:unnamed protein product [Symbiodinium necroappetens]
MTWRFTAETGCHPDVYREAKRIDSWKCWAKRSDGNIFSQQSTSARIGFIGFGILELASISEFQCFQRFSVKRRAAGQTYLAAAGGLCARWRTQGPRPNLCPRALSASGAGRALMSACQQKRLMLELMELMELMGLMGLMGMMGMRSARQRQMEEMKDMMKMENLRRLKILERQRWLRPPARAGVVNCLVSEAMFFQTSMSTSRCQITMTRSSSSLSSSWSSSCEGVSPSARQPSLGLWRSSTILIWMVHWLSPSELLESRIRHWSSMNATPFSLAQS